MTCSTFKQRSAAHRSIRSSIAWCAALLVTTTFSGIPPACANVFDDFADGNDTLNPTWTHSDVGLGGVQTYDASGLNYRLSATVGGFGFSYLGSFVETTSDFTITLDLVDWGGGAQKFGAFARATGIDTFAGVSGYHFSYQPDNGQVLLRRMINANQAGANLASATVTLEAGKDYQFVFTGSGSSLNGKIFEIGGPATPVADLSATDTAFTSGLSGIVGFGLNAPTDFTIDNFSHVVPEPSSLSLLFLGALLCRGALCRRRGNAP